MFWFITGIFLIVVAAIFVIASFFTMSGEYDRSVGEYERVKLTPLRYVAAGVAAFGVLLMLLGGSYTQDPGEVVVIKSLGGDIKDTDTSPGFGWTAPWNKKIGFNIRNQRIEMFSNEGGEGKDGAAISAPLETGSNVSVSVTIRYGIRPECVEDIYRKHRSQDNLLDNVLKPGLRDEVRVATSEYTAFEVKQSAADLAATLVTELNDRWEDECVEVDNVDLGQLRLPEATETALDAVNERALQQEAARADLQTARIEAETTKTDAQAQADADQIIRCGATVKTSTEEVNGQPTEVVKVTPKTGAACENRLNEQVILNNWIQALQQMGADGNLIVVPENVDAILDAARGATPAPAG